MEHFRSKSYNDGTGDMQTESHNETRGPSNMQDLRCYSASYANCVQQKEVKMKKSKSKGSFGSSSKTWTGTFADPEIQRKKRVASYKVYAVEGKMKGSLRKSFRWIKETYTQVVYGHG